MTLIKLGFFLNPFLAGLRGVPKSLQVDGIWYLVIIYNDAKSSITSFATLKQKTHHWFWSILSDQLRIQPLQQCP